MDWGTLIISIIGLLLGGGIVGQLIMFFVKRSDEKKEKERDFYRVIYHKLCDYYSSLEEMRLNCYKEIHKHGTLTEKSHTKAEENLLRIDKLLKSIKSRERKCRRYGKPDSEICSKCNSDRQFVVDLHDESKALQQEAANNLDLIDNYWSNHYEQTYSILSSYANMENFIYARKGCDNKILACIRIIDQCTRSMCSNLSFKKSSDWDFEDALIKQTASISVALKYISERL